MFSVIIYTMYSFLSKIISGIVGTALSLYFIKEITYDNSINTIIIVGVVIGLLMMIIRPILNVITFPLRIITLNLFSFVIIMFLIWTVDCIFPRTMIEINGLSGIFWMSLIVLGTDALFSTKNE